MNTLGNLTLLHTTLGIIANQQVDVAKLIYEAHRLGIKVIAYTNGNNLAVRDADVIMAGHLDDKAKLKEFATQCQAVMYMNGSGISGELVNYLNQFTNVPQGVNSLDIINDLSIQRVFLNLIHVPSLPYDTVFSVEDVKQALTELHAPILLRPVQTSYVQQRNVIITDFNQLSDYQSIFNGEAYLVESLPSKARYFKVTVMKSDSKATALPVVEERYKGQKLDYATVDSHESTDWNGRLSTLALNVANHINYTGSLTVSFVLTEDDQIYVDGVGSSFDFINNVYNRTPDNIYRLFLLSIMGLSVSSTKPKYSWTIKVVDQNNLTQLEKLWSSDRSVILNLSSLVNRTSQNGYMLISTLPDDNEKS